MKKLFALVLAMVMVFSFANSVMAETESKELTRAAFVKVIYSAESVLNAETEEYANVFADVETDSYYEDAISWAAAAGIVKGVSDTMFDPDALITREQVATMVYRYYDYKGLAPHGVWAILVDAKDAASISEYAVKGVMFALVKDMLAFDASGNFNPTAPITNAELDGVVANLYSDIK